METLFNDIRYGIRGLLKRPGFTFIAILTLALGVGANTAIFSVVNGVLLRPLPFENAEQLVVPWGSLERSDAAQVVSYPDFIDWREQTQTLAFVAAHTSAGALLYDREEPELISGAAVSADIFPVLGIKPVLGQPFTREQDQPNSPRVMALSYNLWQQRFNADPNIIGRQLRIGSVNATVVSVLPPDFKFPVSANKTDFLQTLAPALGERTERRGSYALRVVARLKPGVTVAQAANEMKLIGQRIEHQHPDEGLRLGLQLVTLHEATVGRVRGALLILLGAVGLVLLIACANIANLLLARAASRHKEMAVRTAIGANRWRIIRQLLTESLLLSSLGGGLGLLLAVWGLNLIITASPLDIPRLKDVGLDARVLGFTAAISILTGIVFGLAPALKASRINLNESLKEGGRGATEDFKRNRVRSLLVISEVALSLLLLVGAGLLLKSFLQLREVNPGFNAENVLVTDISLARTKYPTVEQQQAAFAEIADRTNAVPGVAATGMVDLLPLAGGASATTFFIAGRPAPLAQDKPRSNRRTIMGDYFGALRIPLLKGRAFSDRDVKTAPQVIIVNETFARSYFPGEEALGKRITIEVDPAVNPNPPSQEIVGIVGDVRHVSLEEEAGSEFYQPFAQTPSRFLSLVVRTHSDDPASLAMSVRNAVKQVDKEQYVPDIKPMSQMLANSVAQRRFNTLLFGLFAIVALILASIGIYGVLSYSVTQRTQEIGIRMALGAQVRDVFKLVVGQAMALVLVGVGIGLLGAFAITRVMSRMLFGVSATDPLTFASVATLLAVIAFLACLLPARRATKVDPVVLLRSE